MITSCLQRISIVSGETHGKTYNEAAVDAKTQAHQHEDKSDLIRPESQGAWPKSQCRSQRVNDCKAQRKCKDVVHGEIGILSQMCHDHSANRVCIDQASVEDEGYKMVVKDNRLEVEIRGDMG